MTRTAGAQIGCQRPSRFWGLGCPKIYHEVEDTLVIFPPFRCSPSRTAGLAIKACGNPRARYWGSVSISCPACVA
ncbi:hypothetical protein, partial [Thiolapillus sp.]|uniref:hypothetical protein n=1 Tax=Thiolapillus sp. TaxID=2017437 RepID=UPI003AF439FC